MAECWDHDGDGWCPKCNGDPDRCPRTGRDEHLALSPVAAEPDDESPCAACSGHGDIWTSWHPTPVQCGVCHGTGTEPPKEGTDDSSTTDR